MPNDTQMHVASYVGLVRESEDQLARALGRVAEHHGDEPDIAGTCELLAGWSRAKREAAAPAAARYGEESDDEPERLVHDLFRGPRKGPLALMRDLQDLYLLASEVDICWTVLAQAAAALRDESLAAACGSAKGQTHRQLAWLTTRIKQAAPQALVVA